MTTSRTANALSTKGMWSSRTQQGRQEPSEDDHDKDEQGVDRARAWTARAQGLTGPPGHYNGNPPHKR